MAKKQITSQQLIRDIQQKAWERVRDLPRSQRPLKADVYAATLKQIAGKLGRTTGQIKAIEQGKRPGNNLNDSLKLVKRGRKVEAPAKTSAKPRKEPSKAKAAKPIRTETPEKTKAPRKEKAPEAPKEAKPPEAAKEPEKAPAATQPPEPIKEREEAKPPKAPQPEAPTTPAEIAPAPEEIPIEEPPFSPLEKAEGELSVLERAGVDKVMIQITFKSTGLTRILGANHGIYIDTIRRAPDLESFCNEMAARQGNNSSRSDPYIDWSDVADITPVEYW